ncbi:MAG TPA: carboxylesterase family protein [Candidatus Sulfotelmatobacter sp.]|nr:carboxylesterase family protein [Candidatus Sulfotelmatobacter sp.]
MRAIRIAVFAAAQVIISCMLANAQVVSTDLGKVKGETADGVTSFKGIPFATPPVGQFRWRPPQPAASWAGVRDATQFGHDCMQKPFPSDAAPLGTTPAEDCLVGNVWIPEHHTGKLPILIWIYGGGWVNGGSSPDVYDGSQFAKQGILFYSFNYRVGRFGFFAHPALTAESKDGMLGNYGFMDQIAAIKWIRRNAAAFGGDPDNVTVFGESAGGWSINMLMTSSLVSGLFHRAMAESGGGREIINVTGLREGMNKRPSAEQIGVAFASTKGISGTDASALEKLRALPPESLVDGLNLATMQAQENTNPGPMIDGKIVVGRFDDLYSQGKNQKLPLVAGANSMDIGFAVGKTTEELFSVFGPDAQAAQKVYDPSGSADIRALQTEVGADALMLEPARFSLRMLTAQDLPAWEYRFSYVATSMRSLWPGAPHATEIPFVFDTVKAKYGAQLSEDDARMAKQVNTYWGNFAKTGDPNGKGLPSWPRYEKSTDELMNFTLTGPKAEADPRKKQLDLTEMRVKSAKP